MKCWNKHGVIGCPSDLTGLPKISVSGKFSPLKCDAVDANHVWARFCNINTVKGAKTMYVF